MCEKIDVNNLEPLLDESTININYCFDGGSETLACSNQMILIYFGHCVSYGGLHRFYSVLYVVVQLGRYEDICLG